MKFGDYPDGPLPAPRDVPAPKKATLKRYAWSRLHADLPTSDLWNLVADIAQCSRERVEALVWRLEVYASTNRPRGSIEGFNIRALAASWRCPHEELARVFAALEDVDVGWIEDDVIVTFWERNPDEEDPTGPARSRRSRKRRAIKQAMLAKGASVADILDEFERQGVAYPQTLRDTRVAVTVTARSDQIKQQRSTEAVDNCAAETAAGAEGTGEEAAAPDDAQSTDAATWLETEGTRLVVERLQVPTNRARTLIERWSRDLGDDAPLMVNIIDSADKATRTVPHFLVTVTDAVRRHLDVQRSGRRLPLPPVPMGPATGQQKPPTHVSPVDDAAPADNEERKRSHG